MSVLTRFCKDQYRGPLGQKPLQSRVRSFTGRIEAGGHRRATVSPNDDMGVLITELVTQAQRIGDLLAGSVGRLRCACASLAYRLQVGVDPDPEHIDVDQEESYFESDKNQTDKSCSRVRIFYQSRMFQKIGLKRSSLKHLEKTLV
jgi:hypothetical protein